MNRAQAHALVLLAAAGAWLPAAASTRRGWIPPDDTIAFPASAIDGQPAGTGCSSPTRTPTSATTTARWSRSAWRAPPSIAGRSPIQPILTILCTRNGSRAGRVSHPNPRTDKLPFCCWDALDRNALNCDERAYIGPDGDIGNGAGNIRIGSFAAAMVLQKPECPTTCADARARTHPATTGC